MVCDLVTKNELPNWCERHQIYHNGHYAGYAVDPGEKGQRFRKLWDEQKGIEKKLLRPLTLAKSCTHNTGENGTTKAGCGMCTTYGCDIKGTVKLKDCFYCEDWQGQEQPAKADKQSPTLTVNNTVRNLLYHIYPVKGNGAWQWNVEQLCGRLKAFNGQKIVAIVTDPPTGRLPDPTGPHQPDRGRVIPGCDTADEVKAEFARRWPYDDITFMEFDNDPSLREVKPLIPMLEQIVTDDPYSVTLYAQAKGTTRAIGHVARRWTEALYEIMFDHFPLAIEQLNSYHCTGCFKKLGPGWSREQTHSDWHYSGSYFWFKSAELFNRQWTKIDQFWSGIEPYPSQQFRADESGCMFLEGKVPEINLYNQGYWRRTVTPLFNKWRSDMASYRTTMWPK